MASQGYANCNVIMAKLGAKVDKAIGPPTPSAETGYLADGTQANCYMWNTGSNPAQTVYGPNWHVDVFGATQPEEVATILGGNVGS